MLGVVFVRRLREGKTYADFVDAWYPDSGFGVPARILSGPGVADPREVLQKHNGLWFWDESYVISRRRE